MMMMINATDNNECTYCDRITRQWCTNIVLRVMYADSVIFLQNGIPLLELRLGLEGLFYFT